MSLPVIFGGILIMAIGVLLFLSWRGGVASGERLEIQLSTTCPEAAAPLISARIESVGLGEPSLTQQDNTITIVATMPGNPDDRTSIPQLLSQTGAFSASHQGTVIVTPADVEDAKLDFDDSGMPLTSVILEPETARTLAALVKGDPTSELRLMLDGELLATRPNAKHIDGQTLQIISGEGLTQVRMKRAVDWTIMIQHGPLPCPVSVLGVANAEALR